MQYCAQFVDSAEAMPIGLVEAVPEDDDPTLRRVALEESLEGHVAASV